MTAPEIVLADVKHLAFGRSSSDYAYVTISKEGSVDSLYARNVFRGALKTATMSGYSLLPAGAFTRRGHRIHGAEGRNRRQRQEREQELKSFRRCR